MKKTIIQNEFDGNKEIFYKCIHHGELNQHQVIKKSTLKDGSFAYRCRQCMRDMQVKHYIENKTNILIKQAEYRKNNRERVLQHKREVRKGKPITDKDRMYKKRYERKNIDNLGDRYIKKLLVKRTKLSMKDIPQSLVDCVRAIKSLKRQIKTQSVEEKIANYEEKNK